MVFRFYPTKTHPESGWDAKYNIIISYSKMASEALHDVYCLILVLDGDSFCKFGKRFALPYALGAFLVFVKEVAAS